MIKANPKRNNTVEAENVGKVGEGSYECDIRAKFSHECAFNMLVISSRISSFNNVSAVTLELIDIISIAIIPTSPSAGWLSSLVLVSLMSAKNGTYMNRPTPMP